MPVPNDVAQSRLSLCKTCEHYQPTLTRCGKCGCIMSLKVKLRGAQCPLLKWDKYGQQRTD